MFDSIQTAYMNDTMLAVKNLNRRGSFVLSLAQTWILADEENKEILMGGYIALVDKFDLNKDKETLKELEEARH